jgi:iron complex outermembrane recepter protein
MNYSTKSRQILSIAVKSALLSGLFLNHASAQISDAETLDEIIVTASPLGERADETAQPVAVVRGQALLDHTGAQAGSAVEHLPGVQSSFFGAGVGRPIIRGLEGARVQVLSGGVSSMDASTVSPDHAVAIEPFLADQIEVLKGPATLLYGSGAIGGVVNIADGRLPEQVKLGASGRAELSGDSGANARLGALRADYGVEAGSGAWMLHADAVYRDQDNYEIPDQAESTLAGTGLESRNAGVSASYLGESARFGLSLSQFNSLYGIPEEEEAEETASLSPSSRSKSVDASGVRIDLEQDRIDVSAALLELGDFFEQAEIRYGSNDYQHVELEGDEVGTLFDVQSHEARLETVHAGLIGEGKGALGLTNDQRDFKAIGEEAFVPFSKSRGVGLFTVQHIESGAWHTDVGVRFDRVKLRAEGFAERSDSLRTASFATRYSMESGLQLTLNLDRAERAPVAEELFSEGAHIAAQSYERGDADLEKESSFNAELGAHLHLEDTHFSASVYRNRFNDFIYQQDGNEIIDDLPLQIWTQADARFTGVELQASTALMQDETIGTLRGEVIFDRVNARLDAGGNLPRIAPQRVGANLTWALNSWQARLGAVRNGKQDRTAEFESSTDGFTRVDLDLSRDFTLGDAANAQVFLRVRNATDQLARAHTSFLKEFAPLPGRNIGLGVRIFW